MTKCTYLTTFISKHVIMACLRHFNHKEHVWDEYDIITTLNQNEKYE